MVVIVKIGGSMMEYSEDLSDLCLALARFSREYEFIIIPGGGRFADVVREFYARLELSEQIAHMMAVLAMDQYGLLLHDLARPSSVSYILDEAVNAAEHHLCSILLPSQIIFSEDPLERSWRVTSDSIAAYFAGRMRERKLILVKDVEGIFTSDPKSSCDAQLLDQISAEDFMHGKVKGGIDEYLPAMISQLKLTCFVVDGRHIERVLKLIEGASTICTKITSEQS